MVLPLTSLDQTNTEDENLTILDYISSDYEQQPEQRIEAVMNKEYVAELLSSLDEEEKLLVMYKYGLLDGKERDKKGMAASLRRMGEVEVQKKLDVILAKLRTIADKEKANL